VVTTRCSASQRPIRGGTTYATSRTCGSGCYLILLAPSANRVYASEANRLVAAELQIMLGANDQACNRADDPCWDRISRISD
jgi:hypothetical protein